MIIERFLFYNPLYIIDNGTIGGNLIKREQYFITDSYEKSWKIKINISATTINSVEHSNPTTILAVGGNHTTILGYSSNTNHNDKEEQIKILQMLIKDLKKTMK